MTNNEEFEKILENIDENGPEPQEEPERQYYFIKKARALVKKMSEELGRPLISSVTTFGCPCPPDNRLRHGRTGQRFWYQGQQFAVKNDMP